MSGRDVIGGKGGSVALTSNAGQVAINNRVQVSHDGVNRRSASGGSIILKSGKTSGVAINVANTSQLLSLLDAAAPGPGGKVVIQATAPTGNSQVNISGKVQADRGIVDVRNSGASGQVNLNERRSSRQHAQGGRAWKQRRAANRRRQPFCRHDVAALRA